MPGTGVGLGSVRPLRPADGDGHRDLTPHDPLGYVLLVLLALSALAMCWRLTVAREVVVLEGDRLRFGRRGRTVLHRDEIARVSSRRRTVTLRLLPPDATHVCDRSHFHRRQVLLLGGDFHDGDQLPAAVEAWSKRSPFDRDLSTGMSEGGTHPADRRSVETDGSCHAGPSAASGADRRELLVSLSRAEPERGPGALSAARDSG